MGTEVQILDGQDGAAQRKVGGEVIDLAADSESGGEEGPRGAWKDESDEQGGSASFVTRGTDGKHVIGKRSKKCARDVRFRDPQVLTAPRLGTTDEGAVRALSGWSREEVVEELACGHFNGARSRKVSVLFLGNLRCRAREHFCNGTTI